MKNYVKEYKGHKVPEWATHVSAFPTPQPIEFYRVIGGTYQFFNTGTVNPAWCKSVFNEANKWSIELPEAPQEWDGEGLPPAGVECEALLTQTWVTVFIVGNAHEYGLGVENIKTGEIHKVDPEKIKFRPLKTQQEKDREAFMSAARKATNADENDIVATDIFDDMFHAGFTAPKEGDNDK